MSVLTDSSRRTIRTLYHFGRVVSYFNLRLRNPVFNLDEVKERLSQIFQLQHNPFKLQASFGVLLQHITTKEFRYYWSSDRYVFRALSSTSSTHLSSLQCEPAVSET